MMRPADQIREDLEARKFSDIPGAHARLLDDVPDLLAEVERLTTELADALEENGSLEQQDIEMTRQLVLEQARSDVLRDAVTKVREPKNRSTLEQRAAVTADLLAEVERLTTELADYRRIVEEAHEAADHALFERDTLRDAVAKVQAEMARYPASATERLNRIHTILAGAAPTKPTDQHLHNPWAVECSRRCMGEPTDPEARCERCRPVAAPQPAEVFEDSTEHGPLFEGYNIRDCGDHRTVGAHRAWCYDCAEWCYPGEKWDDPMDTVTCRGCAAPGVRWVAAVETEGTQP